MIGTVLDITATLIITIILHILQGKFSHIQGRHRQILSGPAIMGNNMINTNQ